MTPRRFCDAFAAHRPVHRSEGHEQTRLPCPAKPSATRVAVADACTTASCEAGRRAREASAEVPTTTSFLQPRRAQRADGKMLLGLQHVRFAAVGHLDTVHLGELLQPERLHILSATRFGRGVPSRKLFQRFGVEERRPVSDGDHHGITLHFKLLAPHDDLVPLQKAATPQRSSEVLFEVVLLFREDFLDHAGALLARDELCPHVDRVVLLQFRVLSQPLDHVGDVSGDGHELQVPVGRVVQDYHRLRIRAGIQVWVVAAEVYAPRQRHLLRVDAVTEDRDRPLFLEFQQVLLRQLLHRGHHLRPVFAQPLSDLIEDQLAREGHVVGSILELDIHHVQLLLQVLLERLQVLQVLGVLVHNRHALQGHLQPDLLALAGHSSELNDALHARHGADDVGVNLKIWRRNHHEVNGGRFHSVAVRQCLGKVPVDELSQERRHWSQKDRHVEEHLVQGAQGRQGLLGPAHATHPLAVEADVPICEVLQEGK
mmetsp:Transcript_11125/g.29573  ORF Transcript_11125/g.29573 Transcript_11125/m.29573 type:complete len:485 (+) Transcript_11125:24-1478(+)